MNKSYKLIEEKRNKDRVVESVKHEIRKYIKREKNKSLPKDVDFWKLECKISKDNDALVFVEFPNLIKTIDTLVLENAQTLNIEILSFEGIIKHKEIVKKNTSNDTIEEEQWLEEIHNGDEKAIKTQKWLEGEPKVKWNFGLEVYYNDRNRGRKYQKQH